jgi:hypothetical protein
MVSYSDEQIKDLITQDFTKKRSIFWHQLLELERPLWRIVPTNSKTRIPEGEVNGEVGNYDRNETGSL